MPPEHEEGTGAGTPIPSCCPGCRGLRHPFTQLAAGENVNWNELLLPAVSNTATVFTPGCAA